MRPPLRIGVFGGTFDPPHVGHRIVALDVVEALALDRLVVVPGPRPPHRNAVLPPDVRLELTRLAFADAPRIEVSDIEFHREGPSWTVETLERIHASHPEARLFLVIGTDQYEGFGAWRRPERILELAELAVMGRDGRPPEPDPRFPFRPIAVTSVDISGTDIRRRLSEGRPVRYLVPDAILEDLRRAWNETMEAERTTGYETRC